MVIEGHDGTGKSEQVDRLGAKLEEIGIDSVQVHEPAGVPIANELRTIIKNGDLKRDPISNILMFTAARRESWLQMMQPALEEGKWVLGARNWYSTLAYQGHGEEVDLQRIETITKENLPSEYITPDLAILLTLEDEEQRAERILGRGKLERPDTFESKNAAFQERVYKGYLQIAQTLDLITVNASPTIEEVRDDIWSNIDRRFKTDSQK